jgi:hypothetical protein
MQADVVDGSIPFEHHNFQSGRRRLLCRQSRGKCRGQWKKIDFKATCPSLK